MTIAGLKAAVHLAAWLGLVLSLAAPPAAAEALDRDEVASRTDIAAGYLASVQLPNGLFAYEYDFVQGRLSDDDNIVRQAGAAFALAEFLNKGGRSEDRRYAERALRGLAAKSLRHDDEGALVVSGTDELSGGRTGATALALLTEINYFEATRDDSFADKRMAWLHSLAAMQLASGGFADAPGSHNESPYFNGEAWLALAHFNRLFPDDQLARETLAKVDAYLIDRYSSAPDTAFFHWGALAASVRYETTGETRFLDFVSSQSEAFVTKLRPTISKTSNECYSVEGLAAAAAALVKGGRDRTALYEGISARITAELTKSFGMQIMPGQARISLGNERYLVDPAIARFSGAFLNGRTRPQTRIDFTQHCLSAALKYAKWQQTLSPGN